ncbi:MAG: excinuclease ABC subunit UvrA [Planctomycetia bacterium]|nr:excinuclease ABC subunit UvrA [Planctomycetia bacterium]
MAEKEKRSAVRHVYGLPTHVKIRGAKANNLKNLDLDIPLNRFVAVCGVSGSGKSTLATDVLYAEGSRRYLQALSTYTRRRIGQTARPNVESIHFLPSSIALRQRPTVPGVRSTVGTMSEILNILRLAFSRLGSHICPNGHRQEPSLDVAQLGETYCTECGVKFTPPAAEDFAFNSLGACPTCHGTGEVESIDESALIADPNKTIREGAVAGWRVPGSFFYVPTAEVLGIPVDIPFRELTVEEQDFVLHGIQKERVPVVVSDSKGKKYDMMAQYLNAADAVAHAYHKTENEKIRARLAAKFYHVAACPTCHGSRFAPRLLNTKLAGKNIAEVCTLPLDALKIFVSEMISTLPKRIQPMGKKLAGELIDGIQPLLELGLSYLSLDRGGGTLSTGELQRIQLARTLRNETTGVLYVLDEPSIGLHPRNVEGLVSVFDRLLAQGNSLIVVDHDLDLLREADWLIELGPGAGINGGRLLAEGNVQEITTKKDGISIIGPYLSGKEALIVRDNGWYEYENGNSASVPPGKWLKIGVGRRYTLENLDVSFPVGKLTAVTGMSGSGKSTLVLDCLVPAVSAVLQKKKVPEYVSSVETAGIRRIVTVDATPLGKNSRSTVATYSGILDVIRPLFASLPESKKRRYDAGRFSYNLKSGACPTCGGAGTVTLDIQYLPDMELTCPDCGGKRYSDQTLEIYWNGLNIAEILDLTVEEAEEIFCDIPTIRAKLEALSGLGLGYLKLGEPTPNLSGGEAQRLRLVSETGRNQSGTLFVFDEPTTGLHPRDIRRLLQVIDQLIASGGTVIVIEHDLDIIANSDYVLDMGPGGGEDGGKIVTSGKPWEICASEASWTGKYLKIYAQNYDINW